MAALQRLRRTGLPASSSRHDNNPEIGSTNTLLPTAPFALFVLAALLPGWIFVRLAERRAPRPDRSGFAELVELAAVGFSAVALSALIVAGLSWARIAGLFNVSAWARTRGSYLGEHIGPALLSAALVAILSCIFSVGLFFVIYKFKSKGIHPESTVWYDVLGRTPENKRAWVGVQRTDGSLVEGFLLSYSYTDEDSKDIGLQRPMRLTPAGGSPGGMNLDRLIVPGAQIEAISVVHVTL